VSGCFNGVGWVQQLQALDLGKDIWIHSLLSPVETLVYLAVALWVTGVVSLGSGEISQPILDTFRTPEYHIYRLVGGEIADVALSVSHFATENRKGWDETRGGADEFVIHNPVFTAAGFRR
jgi:hypothetical protein